MDKSYVIYFIPNKKICNVAINFDTKQNTVIQHKPYDYEHPPTTLSSSTFKKMCLKVQTSFLTKTVCWTVECMYTQWHCKDLSFSFKAWFPFQDCMERMAGLKLTLFTYNRRNNFISTEHSCSVVGRLHPDDIIRQVLLVLNGAVCAEDACTAAERRQRFTERKRKHVSQYLNWLNSDL